MPQFGLRGIYAAKYNNNSGTVTYTNKTAVGDAITANLELRFAEGRLYAEDMLAEYMRKATGGTISLGVKYIKDAAQTLLFGVTTKARSISYKPTGGATTTVTATSTVTGGNTEGDYVGIAFYSPDMVDGVKKYSCVFVKKALFGPPAMSLQTMGENITFQTPTTSGEFLADDTSSKDLFEVVILDSEDAAKAWVQAVLGTA